VFGVDERSDKEKSFMTRGRQGNDGSLIKSFQVFGCQDPKVLPTLENRESILIIK
jgi:hypothetical protein